MNYVMVLANGFILAIGTGIENSVPISEAEYNKIRSIIQEKPPRSGTTDYHLREDLTWEAYEIEPPDPDPEISDSELLHILMGGAE